MADLSIVLIEDNPLDARFIVRAFGSSSIQNSVTILQDGDEAVKFLKKEGIYAGSPAPDLVLLDLRLPKKSGLEVLKDMNESGMIKKTTVVVITSSDSGQDIEKCAGFGVKKFITKPFDIESFTKEIQSIEPILEEISRKK